jgi:hypothetical protein
MKAVLILYTVRENMKSYNDFQWPGTGLVECKDWDSTPECGNGCDNGKLVKY